MSGKASSSHLPGCNGSGALSHVYVQYPPLRCKLPGARYLFYDDGSKLLIAPTSNQIVSWKAAPFTPQVAPFSDPISEGPVLSVRYSLDFKLLAIQRSNHEVQIYDRETGAAFSQKCKSESESILGFFWTDCPTCDIVFVKTSGLELFSYNYGSKSLHLVETKRLNVSWYVYTHESRLVLLASGMQCKSFTGYQLSSVGIIRLPRFEMTIAKSEANSKPVLAAEDIHIITVYGRIYCLQFDRVAMQLNSYRFYRDAVVYQGSLPIYSSRVGVSVVDNVLLVHQVDAKVVIIYDIFADSRAPISAPLPLLRGYPRPNSASLQSVVRNAGASGAKELSDSEATIYGDDWIFLVPDLICDVANGLLWKIHIDLEAISASSSDVPFVLEFLQRRKLEANQAKQLCLAITRTIILERRPVPIVAKAIDVLVTSYAHSIRTGSHFKGIKEEKPSSSNPGNANTADDESISRVDPSGITVKDESVKGIQNEPTSTHTLLTSDSEDNASSEIQQNNSQKRDSSIGADGKYMMTTPASTVEVHPSAVQSQILGADRTPLNANASEKHESQLTSAAVSPDDLYTFVLAPVEEEMVGDASYLVAIILEFLRSVYIEKLKVHPNIYVLTVQLLARSQRYTELGLFISDKILEPSKEVAMQLLESGRQNSQTRKFGLDMLKQLSLHHDYVLLLMQDGYYLEALRYARKNKVNTVQPSLFLEAAYASNDSQHVAAVLRFFSDFIPGFKSTLDFSTYTRMLAEMDSSITA